MPKKDDRDEVKGTEPKAKSRDDAPTPRAKGKDQASDAHASSPTPPREPTHAPQESADQDVLFHGDAEMAATPIKDRPVHTPNEASTPAVSSEARAPGSAAVPPPELPEDEMEEHKSNLEDELQALQEEHDKLLQELQEQRAQSIEVKEDRLRKIQQRISHVAGQHKLFAAPSGQADEVMKQRALAQATENDLRNRLAEFQKQRVEALTEDEIIAELARRGHPV